jgi:hypothetical protein
MRAYALKLLALSCLLTTVLLVGYAIAESTGP